MWGDSTVSWGMNVLVLKGGSEQRTTASTSIGVCDAALVPSGCGRFQMLIVSLALELLNSLETDQHCSSWLGFYLLWLKLPNNFPFGSQFPSLLLCWGLLTPPGSPLRLSCFQDDSDQLPPEIFLAYIRSGLKKILWTLLSKCYQKERSTSLNQIHDPWQMCSVFHVAYIQQFPTTGQIISLSENMICN